MAFLKAYVASMRLYYAPVTGLAGWVGVAAYTQLAATGVGRQAVVVALLFATWGVNQIINDWLGLREDRLNAPHRPMVSGALAVKPALAVTVVLLALTCVVAWRLNPWSLLPAVAGIALNVVYEFAKGRPLAGPLVFGVMLVMCPVFGFLACGPWPEGFCPSRIYWSVLLFIAAANAVMTFFTYFKDEAGDRMAGKQTCVVRYGRDASRQIGVALAIGMAVWISGFVWRVNQTPWFVALAMCAAAMQLETAWQFFRDREGRKSVALAGHGFAACLLADALALGLMRPEFALWVGLATVAFCATMFVRHGDSKS